MGSNDKEQEVLEAKKMRSHYDFSKMKGRKNPYIKPLKPRKGPARIADAVLEDRAGAKELKKHKR